MNIEQLEKGLLAKLAQSRIVFWYDSELFREVCILTPDNLALYGTYARGDHPCELPCLRMLFAQSSHPKLQQSQHRQLRIERLRVSAGGANGRTQWW